MKIRSMIVVTAACAALASTAALAHPGGHEDEAKPLPTTCAHLKDARYVADDAYPEVKKLKAKCAAEQSKTASPAPKPTAAATSAPKAE